MNDQNLVSVLSASAFGFGTQTSVLIIHDIMLNLIQLDALLRVPKQSLYWEALAILQLSLNVLHLKSCEIQSNRLHFMESINSLLLIHGP